MKRSRAAGFAVMEMSLVIFVLLALGVAGYFIFRHEQSAKPAKGWLVYKSAHSAVQFMYPQTWQVKQVSLSGKPNYYLEDALLAGPNNFALEFAVEKAHARPNQTWACTMPPKQMNIALKNRYEMVVTDQGGVSLLAAGSKNTVPDDFACGSRINVLAPDKLFKFTGGYAVGGLAQQLDGLINQPEMQTAQAIFTSLKQ